MHSGHFHFKCNYAIFFFFFTGGKVIFYTVHPVRLHKLFVLFVNTEGMLGKLLNVFIKIPAQIFIEDCE